MTTADTAALLEDAADRIADISRAELQIMLRRAALRLRNAGAVSMEDNVEEALHDLAGEFGMTRNDKISPKPNPSNPIRNVKITNYAFQ